MRLPIIIPIGVISFAVGWLIGITVSRPATPPPQLHTLSLVQASPCGVVEVGSDVAVSTNGIMTIYWRGKRCLELHSDGTAEFVNGCSPDRAAAALLEAYRLMWNSKVRDLMRKTNS